MSIAHLLRVLARRWWLILALVAVGAAAALAYSGHQRPLYQASISLHARPSSTLDSEQRSEIRTLMSDGRELTTLVTIAKSPRTLDRITSLLRLQPHATDGYSVAATAPSSTRLHLTVDGSDPDRVRRITAQVPNALGSVAGTEFFVSLSPFDSSTSVQQLRPEKRRNVIIGGLAGLLVGCVLAAWSVPRAGAVGSEGREEQYGDATAPPAP
jgi:uncharacterized protein involved in exopolysaccharide biosynthesis